MTSTAYDLIILGSGSTAFAAALRAQELGKTAVMTEERTIGGTCVNRGCLPSKNLIEAAKLVYDADHPRYPGLKPCRMEVDFKALVSQKNDVIKGYRNKKYESLLGGQIAIEKGHVQFVDDHTVEIDGKQLTGEKILIATGSRPAIPKIEGLDQVPYLTSDLLSGDESMELTELPPSLIILGGGYIALELGQMFSRFGVPVTILERNSQLLYRGYEPEIGQTIGKTFEEEGIQVMPNVSILSVIQEKNQVVVIAQVKGFERRFVAARLLVTTGRQPNTAEIGIERSGVALGDKREVKVNQFLQTNVPHIFAAGDVIGRSTGSQLATPVGSQDGGKAAHNALSKEPMTAVDHRVIPRTIFTDPQVAIVGLTEAEAIQGGHSCWCNTVPMRLVPRAGAIRDTRGFIKMVADAETDQVLGVSIVGANAGEVIHEAAMALRFNAKIQDFINLLHVYPTMAEALKIAAISRYKDPEKLSCCAD